MIKLVCILFLFSTLHSCINIHRFELLMTDGSKEIFDYEGKKNSKFKLEWVYEAESSDYYLKTWNNNFPTKAKYIKKGVKAYRKL